MFPRYAKPRPAQYEAANYTVFDHARRDVAGTHTQSRKSYDASEEDIVQAVHHYSVHTAVQRHIGTKKNYHLHIHIYINPTTAMNIMERRLNG